MESLIYLVLDIFTWVFLAYIVMSWFPDFYTKSFYQKLDEFFSRFLSPIRQAMPPLNISGAAIDLSPIILILFIGLIKNFLLPFIF